MTPEEQKDYENDVRDCDHGCTNTCSDYGCDCDCGEYHTTIEEVLAECDN